jgi:hypothetical protein
MNIADASWHDTRLYYRAILRIRGASVISLRLLAAASLACRQIIEFTVNP